MNKIYAGYDANDLLTNIIYEGNYIKFSGTTSSEVAAELKEKDKQYPGLYEAYYNAMLKLHNAEQLWKQGKKEEALSLKSEVDKIYESKDMSDLYFATKDVENLKLHNNEEVANNVKKGNKFGLKKQIVTGALIATMTLGAIGCATQQAKEPTEQEIEQSQEVEQDLSQLSLEELMPMLHKGAQYDAFKEMSEAQDYFNNTAAPTIKTKSSL